MNVPEDKPGEMARFREGPALLEEVVKGLTETDLDAPKVNNDSKSKLQCQRASHGWADCISKICFACKVKVHER